MRGSTYSGLGLPMSITNQENAPQSDGSIFLTEGPSSPETLVFVMLAENEPTHVPLVPLG